MYACVQASAAPSAVTNRGFVTLCVTSRARTRDSGVVVRRSTTEPQECVSLAEGNLGRGINRAAFENRSTTTRMTVLPWEGGSPVMK